MLLYEALNIPVIDLIPQQTKSLLDIGCGNGALGAYVKAKYPLIHVTGITFSKEEAEHAKENIDEVYNVDLNVFNFNTLKNFDCIICSHVLEHLYHPDALLKKIHNKLEINGTLIIALPNILHWRQRLKFANGDFKYTKGGLMDDTHFRFYDYDSARALITNNGFEILSAKALGSFPLPFFRKVMPGIINKIIDNLACRLRPGLFGFQFVFLCKAK